MKRYPGMNITRALPLVLSLIAAACGGEKSVASKSAEAYREAQAKGVATDGGHGTASTSDAMDHGAHGTTSDAGTTAMDHSTHGAADDTHAGMNHGATPSSGAMDHSAHAAMGHGTTPRARTTDHAAMGHGTTPSAPAATHDHAGMNHGATAPAADPHAQHGVAATQSPAATAPLSNAEMQRVQPPATLSPDAFDRPVAVSVAEAAKAAQGVGHEGHQMPGITPGQDREEPPAASPSPREERSSAPATDHSRHRATTKPRAKPAVATVYTCPMHPEVTSGKPGTCPKCGMALVKKNR